MEVTEKRKFFWSGIALVVVCYALAWVSSYLDRDLPKGTFSQGSLVVMSFSFIASFGGSYLILKAKGRSWRFVVLALLSILGHLLLIFALADKNKKKENAHVQGM